MLSKDLEMTLNQAFDRKDYRLPELRCEEWLGWAFVTLNQDATPVAERLKQVEELVGDYGMEDYVETFFETHVWDTNWKVLAENFMESYHLPVCHAATIGGLSKLEEMVCPPGLPAFNYHTILKDDRLKIAVAHRSNTRLEGERRMIRRLRTLERGGGGISLEGLSEAERDTLERLREAGVLRMDRSTGYVDAAGLKAFKAKRVRFAISGALIALGVAVVVAVALLR